MHHSRERWILDEFGQPGGEGALFILSEFRYLLNKDVKKIPQAAARNASKCSPIRLVCARGTCRSGLNVCFQLSPCIGIALAA